MSGVAVVGVYYDEESPLDSYRGCYARIDGKEFGEFSGDYTKDLVSCIERARYRSELVVLSSSVDNYESDCLRAAREIDNEPG